MRKKLLFVFGTRPEAIKMLPLISQLKSRKNLLKPIVCVTAQHRQMLDQVLNLFKVKPDYDLNIMQEGQTLAEITNKVLHKLEPVLKKEKPDMILVQGDTTTTFAGALAAFYYKIPVGHVEAGLRTYDKFNPYPEEANRMMTDVLSTVYFVPTGTARKALLKENYPADKIFITGNTVIDALFMAIKQKQGFDNPQLKRLFSFCHSEHIRYAQCKLREESQNGILRYTQNDKNTLPCRFILVTAHRRENFGQPIQNICQALKQIVESYSDVQIIYPVHPNPNITNPVHKILSKVNRIHLIPPVDYLDLVNLMKQTYLILTDSGGIQEEAPSLGKPVLVLRKVTERPEAAKSGTVKIVGTDTQTIYNMTSKLLNDKTLYNSMSNAVNPYGDGKAAERTIKAIEYYFGLTNKRPLDFKL